MIIGGGRSLQRYLKIENNYDELTMAIKARFELCVLTTDCMELVTTNKSFAAIIDRSSFVYERHQFMNGYGELKVNPLYSAYSSRSVHLATVKVELVRLPYNFTLSSTTT